MLYDSSVSSSTDAGDNAMAGARSLVVNPEGQLINTTDFICEEEVQTKSQDADRLTLKIKEENISLFFDGYPSRRNCLID